MTCVCVLTFRLLFVRQQDGRGFRCEYAVVRPARVFFTLMTSHAAREVHSFHSVGSETAQTFRLRMRGGSGTPFRSKVSGPVNRSICIAQGFPISLFIGVLWEVGADQWGSSGGACAG